MPITPQQLLQILPNASQVVGVFVPVLNTAMNRYQIVGQKRIFVPMVVFWWVDPGLVSRPTPWFHYLWLLPKTLKQSPCSFVPGTLIYLWDFSQRARVRRLTRRCKWGMRGYSSRPSIMVRLSMT